MVLTQSQYMTPPPYAIYRRIRRDPTISLMRTLMNAAIVSAPWTIGHSDDASEEAVKLIQADAAKWRDGFVEQAVLSGIDFGWGGWEVQWDTSDGRTARILPPKPLLPDITKLMTDTAGNLTGMAQRGLYGQVITLPVADHLHLAWRVEGTNHYGEPLLINAREVFEQWRDVAAAALRFDLKIAGRMLVVRYPREEAETIDRDGVTKPTVEVANNLGERLQAGGHVAIQSDAVATEMKGLADQNQAWSIETLEVKGVYPLYNDRLEYMDKLKVRAMGWPERSVLEASTAGSRADSATSASFAIKNLELMHKVICNAANAGLVNKSLELNFGAEARDSVYLVPGLIDDANRRELETLAAALARRQPKAVDIDSLFDVTGIPKAKEVISIEGA